MQNGKKQLINYHAYVSHNKIEFSKIIPRGIKKLILRYFGVNCDDGDEPTWTRTAGSSNTV